MGKYKVDSFIDFLEAKADNRGIMADLRHGLNPASSERAWPHLAANGWDVCVDSELALASVIGYAFSVLGKNSNCGDFGESMKKLKKDTGLDDEESPVDRRFRRLLACRSTIEICGGVPNALRLLAKNGTAVNLARLYWDMKKWGEIEKSPRRRWARSFWGSRFVKEKEIETDSEVAHEMA